METIELDSLTGSVNTSGRTSLDQSYFRDHACHVCIWDEVEDETSENAYVPGLAEPHYIIHRSGVHSQARTSSVVGGQARSNVAADLPAELKRRLDSRNSSRTRWINVVGWSEDLMNYLAHAYLSDHDCLGINGSPKAMFGGPTLNQSGQEFVWLHTKVWFMDAPSSNWSSIKEVALRIIIVQPGDDAGIIITNFLGKFKLAQEMNRICTDAVLGDHPFGSRVLGCCWIIAYAILRIVTEQIDSAFQILDPNPSDTVSLPQIDALPSVLEKASNLARLERYLSELEELTSFFEAVQKMGQAENTVSNPNLSSYRLIHRTTLERSRLQQKILHSKRLSRTYLTQYKNLTQMTITYATTQITERLDKGRIVAERFATVGVFLGAVSSLLSPMALLTSYYGMNVHEFVGERGGLLTLYEFWKWGLPLTIVAITGASYLVLRVMTGRL